VQAGDAQPVLKNTPVQVCLSLIQIKVFMAQ
jgi:hypothetical protein